MTPELVCAALESTGIYPFNPDVIKPAQMRPSENTSTHAALPMAQPSPVKAFMNAYHAHKVTVADLDPEHYAGIAGTPLNGSVTPQRHHHPTDENINPALLHSLSAAK